jgi:hypothetical protein
MADTRRNCDFETVDFDYSFHGGFLLSPGLAVSAYPVQIPADTGRTRVRRFG